jgi:hypothetical protein
MALPWRVHLKLAESAALGWWWYNEAIRDDRRFTPEDIDETMGLALGMGWVWGGELLTVAAVSTTPIVAVEAIVAAGAVTSYAIAGTEGVENYVDFITEPSTMVQKTAEVTVPALEKIIVDQWNKEVKEVKKNVKLVKSVLDFAKRRAQRYLNPRYRFW